MTEVIHPRDGDPVALRPLPCLVHRGAALRPTMR